MYHQLGNAILLTSNVNKTGSTEINKIHEAMKLAYTKRSWLAGLLNEVGLQ